MTRHGEPDREEYERQRAEAARRGIFMLSWEKHREKVLKTRLLELEVQEREARLSNPEVGPQQPAELDRPKRGPHRAALPVLAVTEAVRLLAVEKATYEEIERATGLSTRKVGYVVKAFEHRDLAWNGSLVLGPETRNTSAGLILPER